MTADKRVRILSIQQITAGRQRGPFRLKTNRETHGNITAHPAAPSNARIAAYASPTPDEDELATMYPSAVSMAKFIPTGVYAASAPAGYERTAARTIRAVWRPPERSPGAREERHVPI